MDYVMHFRFDESGQLKRYYRNSKNKFVPSTNGGMTIVSESGRIGVAICSNRDTFSYKIGYDLALCRATRADSYCM